MKTSFGYILTIILIYLVCLYTYTYIKPLTNATPITSDGYGYYAYLPSILIDHQVKITDPTKYDPHHNYLEYPAFNKIPNTNDYLNKYPPGTAILMLPGFIIATIISFIIHLPIDGYNPIFQHAVGLSTVSYAVIGLYLLYRLLRNFFTQNISKITTVIILLSTSFITYTTFSPSFSHIYAFVTTALFANIVVKWHKIPHSFKYSILLGITWGLTFLIRNTHIFLIIFWLLYSINSKKINLLKNKTTIKSLATIFVTFLITISPQLIYHTLASGSIQIFSYTSENFNWLDPALYGVLFSPRRGLFFWSPILFLCFPSIIKALKPPPWFYASAVTIAIQTYIIASWHQWWFGDSFGHRAFIDIYPFIALFLAKGIELTSTKKIGKFIIITSLILAISANTILSYKWWTGKLYRDNTFSRDVIQALQIWK